MERYFIAISMILYPLLLFNKSYLDQGNSIFLISALLYLMTTYLYFGMTWLLYHKENVLFAATSVITILVALYITEYQHMTLVLTSLAIFIVAPIVVVKMYLLSIKQNKIYLAAVVLISVFQLIQLSETFFILESVRENAFQQMIFKFQILLSDIGLPLEQINRFVIIFQDTLAYIGRLLPSMVVMDVIVKFSIGFLFFNFRLSRKYNTEDKIGMFPEWKMPVYIAPFLIAAIFARMFGGETLTIVADNILLILSVYYSLTGLSLISFYIKKFQLSVWIRYAFYLFIFLTQLIGYLIFVILGFVDSLVDWRRLENRVVVK